MSTTVWAGQYNWVCPYLGLKNKPQGCDSNPSDPLSRVVDLTPSPHRSNLDAAHRAKKGAMSWRSSHRTIVNGSRFATCISNQDLSPIRLKSNKAEIALRLIYYTYVNPYWGKMSSTRYYCDGIRLDKLDQTRDRIRTQDKTGQSTWNL